uniref:Nuclease associated modular domain-containing protein n=1 Tax=Orbilia brochopaga TaxID=3140254 RepID=A0A481ZM19_9PEZI|nr:hypothetical protein [Drechslerella brochopaga]QBL02573.1 hypothetical protein [Drechslerella brochopaga]
MYGRNHSAKTKKLLSEANKGKTHSAETKKILSEAKKRKIVSAETRAKMSIVKIGKARPVGSGSPAQKISVFDNKNNITTIYVSISAAAEALEIKKIYHI